MLRIFIILSFFVGLTSCGGVSLQTRVGNAAISQKINIFGAKRDLQQFYSDQEAHESGAILLGKADEDVIRQALQFFVWQLEGLRSFEKSAIFAIAKEVATFHELKIKDFLEPIFVAITGKTSSTSVLDAMEILGSDLSRARLRVALAHLGISKKQAKKIERAYREYPSA